MSQGDLWPEGSLEKEKRGQVPALQTKLSTEISISRIKELSIGISHFLTD